MSHREEDTSRSQHSRASSAPVEARLPYVTCEYYLHIISAFPTDLLWLASLPGLQSPAQLAAAAITHVLVLCHPPVGQLFAALQNGDTAGADLSLSAPPAEATVHAVPAPGPAQDHQAALL